MYTNLQSFVFISYLTFKLPPTQLLIDPHPIKLSLIHHINKNKNDIHTHTEFMHIEDKKKR